MIRLRLVEIEISRVIVRWTLLWDLSDGNMIRLRLVELL